MARSTTLAMSTTLSITHEALCLATGMTPLHDRTRQRVKYQHDCEYARPLRGSSTESTEKCPCILHAQHENKDSDIR
eukprot:1275331-Amphidinium_carterae.2